MTLTEQEQRCVDLVLGYRAGRYGGSWQVTEDLDERYPAERTPEVIVTNGNRTAAMEGKQVTGETTNSGNMSRRGRRRFGAAWYDDLPPEQHNAIGGLAREAVACQRRMLKQGADDQVRLAQIEAEINPRVEELYRVRHLGPFPLP